MYFTDRGTEELAERRGAETVSLSWLAEMMRIYVNLHPSHEEAVEVFATWLARAEDEDDLYQ